MNFDLTVKKNDVLLMVYRWLLERREAAFSEGWISETHSSIRKKIAASRKVGSLINVCPIVWSVIRDVLLTMPIYACKFVVMPLGLAAILLGTLWLILWGGYNEFAGWSSTFDWIAFAKIAGIVAGTTATIYALRKPIGYGILYLAAGMIMSFGFMIWISEKLAPAFAWFGNFVFGRVPTKKEPAPSGTLAVLGAWVKGQLEAHCPQALITA